MEIDEQGKKLKLWVRRKKTGLKLICSHCGEHVAAARIHEVCEREVRDQEQFAERAAMQRSYLADLERGHRNPSTRTLVRLANAFDVPLRDLLDELPPQVKRPRRSVRN
jgi:transcriptional regulator with XRE-family HTH domain